MAYQAVIKGNGVYTTRGGRLAFISDPGGDRRGSESRHPGYMLATQGRMVVNQWHSWSSDGRFSTGEHEYDLVRKVI